MGTYQELLDRQDRYLCESIQKLLLFFSAMADGLKVLACFNDSIT
jgi:hypothetical protein